jgi:hypothetical protein
MHEHRQRSFTLRLDVDNDPIAGRLEDESGSGHEFVGWLGLAKALEALLGQPAAGNEGPPASGTDPRPMRR